MSPLVQVIAQGGPVAILAAVVWGQHRAIIRLIAESKATGILVTEIRLALTRVETTLEIGQGAE